MKSCYFGCPRGLNGLGEFCFKGAKSFYETTNRLTCLVQLSQVIKVTLRNHDDVSEISHDWKCLDFDDVARDVAMLCGNEERVFSFVRKSKRLSHILPLSSRTFHNKIKFTLSLEMLLSIRSLRFRASSGSARLPPQIHRLL